MKKSTESVDELYARGRKALLSLHGFGPKFIRTIEEMTERIEVVLIAASEAILFLFLLPFVSSSITTFIAALLLAGSFLRYFILLVSHP